MAMEIGDAEKVKSVGSKVRSEFKTGLGLDEPDLANFVACIGSNCDTVEEFDVRLKEFGIEIPCNLVFSLFFLTHETDESSSDGELDLDLLNVINEENEKFRVLINERRQNLPIYSVKNEIMKAVEENVILVVTGEIGSGKTTQITQYLNDAGYTGNGRRIACTQPHFQIVGYIAERVAEEYGCNLGEQVGYATSFEDFTSEATLIKYMTDDVLVREFMSDPNLSQYSVIVLDEANARTVYTDVLFALLKQLVKQRANDLRLILISAPLDSYLLKFSGYFLNCKVVTIPAITYPVKIIHLETPIHPLCTIVETIHKILEEGPLGGIIIFWHDLTDINFLVDCLCKPANEGGIPELLILPVYRELESCVFKPAPPGKRKLIITSSEFAEVCLTIHGIYYVIDSGLVSQALLNPYRGLQTVLTIPVSKASAWLREGLVRHVDKGTYFRLNTEDFYRDKMPTNYLDINRCNLGSIPLILKALGIQDISSFEFMDPPPPETLTSDTKRLHDFGALDKEGHLTQLGWRMAAFPLDPPLSRMLMAGVDLGCSDEILTIISMIQTQATLFPNLQIRQALMSRAKIFHQGGDLLTMLAIFEEGKSHDFSEEWCREYFILPGLIQRAQVVRNELVRILQEKCKLEVVSAGRNSSKINKAITSAFFFNAAKKDEKGKYRRLIDNKQVDVYIYSVFSETYPRPECVVCHWMGERYIDGLTVIDSQWLKISDVEEQATTIDFADGIDQFDVI